MSPGAFLEGLREVILALFGQIRIVWSAYTTLGVVSAFFALWVLDKVFHIFDILKR